MKKILILPLFLIFVVMIFGYDNNKIIKKEGTPDDITKQMAVIEVKFYNFAGQNETGVIVVNKKYSEELKKIFSELYTIEYPIEKIVPISEYYWDDDKSMADNNTSCYNYRVVKDSKKLSDHSYGAAIDINPKYNPMIIAGKIYPENGIYDIKNKGTILKNSEIVKIFRKYGWKWGGEYKTLKDYQHFYKDRKR